MMIHRRELLRLAGAAAAAVWPQAAWTETYPSRPVRILVGYAAGGGVDIAARLIGQWLSERLQQQFLVENRTGAATNIATEAVVRSPPDGYTLLLVSGANAINATYYENLSFNFMRGIAPVAGIGRFPYFMAINPAFPAKNVSEFIAYAKANPRRVNMRTGGAGGLTPPAADAHPDDARAVSRHSSRAKCPARRAGADGVLHDSVGDPVHQGRHATRNCSDIGHPPGIDARNSDSRRYGAGIRIGSVVRRRRAGRYARRNHRDAQQGGERRPRRSQDEGTA